MCAVWCGAAVAPAAHSCVLLGGAVAVGGVLGPGFVVMGAADHAVEVHAGNDGLGKRRGGWGRGRGRAIVVILTTYNGRLLHLQTTGVFRQQKKKKKGNGKWRQMKMRAKYQVCENSNSC